MVRSNSAALLCDVLETQDLRWEIVFPEEKQVGHVHDDLPRIYSLM